MEEASSETLPKAVTRPRWQERVKKSLSGECSPSTGDTGMSQKNGITGNCHGAIPPLGMRPSPHYM